MAQKRWGKAPYETTYTTGDTRTVYLGGRVRWAIEELRRAGRAGRTRQEAHGPRWAAYMWASKHAYGIPIRDAWEPHAGEHPGRHKRWWLDCDIRPVPTCTTNFAGGRMCDADISSAVWRAFLGRAGRRGARLCAGLPVDLGGLVMTKLQIRYLMRTHGLTEAQAQIYAALIWGAE